MVVFSDFPIPSQYANFMHNSKVWTYFGMYADNFGLREHIRFNTEVVSVTPVEEFSKTGLDTYAYYKCAVRPIL